jgi:hypothetical protein
MNANSYKLDYTEVSEQGLTNPFAMRGYIEFNKQRWGLDLLEKRYTLKGEGPPCVEASLFIDHKGKICLPPWVSHMAINFQSSNTNQSFKTSRKWIELATMLAQDMKEIGVSEPIALPPQITDVRPFQWMGFKTTVRYTYYIDFPFTLQQTDRAVRGNINKALKAGYVCKRSNVPSHILECIAETEERDGFNLQLDEKILELGWRLMGEDGFRCYVCYSPDGEPASSSIVLYSPDGWAADWIVGTKTEHLKDGPVQLAYSHRLADLQRRGCSVFDMVGANMDSIARMKANWGGRLVPYYVIEPYNSKVFKVWLKQWVKQSLIK